ncbi:hypothetical protein JFV29_22560 [Peribacillus sp. TH16]|nr:hypothetical protein [Peribacillus sp. TH16]
MNVTRFQETKKHHERYINNAIKNLAYKWTVNRPCFRSTLPVLFQYDEANKGEQ